MRTMRLSDEGRPMAALPGASVTEGYLNDLRGELDALDQRTVGDVIDKIVSGILDGATIYLAGNEVIPVVG